ncbi:hypothetical protein B4135_1076 [Caldibacillus debilis]|uniref:Uncharacterized protein n=1 Tax=Caldibacillus debilis TaxID=301148 RepID=A0A150ME25_9BACI|nr:hypothetical protein B4135_1076 [Caldibacillus debilis]
MKGEPGICAAGKEEFKKKGAHLVEYKMRQLKGQKPWSIKNTRISNRLK